MKKKLTMEDALKEKPPKAPRQHPSWFGYQYHSEDDFDDDLYYGLTSEDVNPNEGSK